MAKHTTDIIRMVAREQRLSQRVVSDAVHEFFRQVRQLVGKGETVQVTGFGTFYRRERKEAQGRNFRTNETVTIPAGMQAAFRAGELLRNAVDPSRKQRSAGARKARGKRRRKAA
jgi:DNA-binding protein HU-beta